MGKSLRKISRGMDKKNDLLYHPKVLEGYKLGKDMGFADGQEIGSKRQREQDNQILNEWFAQLTSIPGVGETIAKRVQLNFNTFAGGLK